MSVRRRKKTKRKTSSRRKIAFPIADLESHSGYEAIFKKEITTFDSPVSIHIHSKRRRLIDADAVSAKAAIDGLVHAGLLVDDSPEFVVGVSYSQEQVSSYEEEETIMTITEV